MDKNLKNFMTASALVIVFLFIAMLGFVFFYQYSNLVTYNFILIILILFTLMVTLLFISAMVTVFFAYRRKYVSMGLLRFTSAALRFLLPFIFMVSGFVKGSKDIIRNFYIDVNNILVQSAKGKYFPNEVLVLLPHCLQYSDCTYKVTNNIENCRRCGKCTIGDIADIAGKTGVTVSVVTGGTAARNIISKRKPKLVLSVACERDLSSGIADVKKIPVIGLVNERPNGPCFNTWVNVEELKDKLAEILIDGSQRSEKRKLKIVNK